MEWNPSLYTLLPCLLKDSTAQVVFPDAWGDFCGQEGAEVCQSCDSACGKISFFSLPSTSIQWVKDLLFSHKLLPVFLPIQVAELSFESYRSLEDLWRTQSLYFGFCVLFIFSRIYLVLLFCLFLYHSNFFLFFKKKKYFYWQENSTIKSFRNKANTDDCVITMENLIATSSLERW